MDNSEVQLVGGPCGQHGPYTFYKAFRFTKNGEKRIMTLSEFFFVKLWMDSDLVCIGELQLLWIDKNSEQVLASLRLYFLPENTPEGRMDHGEDEVLAISEKVVLRVEDLITWITMDAEWSWGRPAKYVDNVKDSTENLLDQDQTISPRLTETSLDFSDVEKERKLLDIKPIKGPSVIILSYPRYCRYRAVMKRLEGVEDEYIKHKIVYALGGIRARTKDTRVLFCKETFDYPELEGHELLCNHLAPKLKGRPRGKRKKRSVSPGSESNESESSVSNVFSSAKNKITTEGGRNGLRCDSTTSPRRSTRSTEYSESKDFMKKLAAFMKSNRTPIGRIPSLGYKELDLFLFYTTVQKLGGYDSVTANRLWKSIFDDLSGNHSSTSAATVIRRHYERFLLAYERNLKGEEYKPLPVSERRRLKSKAGSSSTSDAETSEGTSRSGNSTPVPQQSQLFSSICMFSTPIENKEFIKMEIKPSSLRSVRVKPERLRENMKDVIAATSPKHEEEMKPHLSDGLQEPATGAVAPVQKAVPEEATSPEKATSPAEGKENIPVFNTTAVQNMNSSSDDDLIEVPYKPKTPEIIDLESDKYTSRTHNNNNNNTNNNNHPQNQANQASEVKRGKLDILKEGGLEVTPVRNFVAPQSKEQRASVIQGTMDKPSMPPPSINATLIKRPAHISPLVPPSPAQSSPKAVKYPAHSAYNFNGTSPPKVMQSKSIYTPSQRTVYGDPKDLFVPQIHQVQTPKFVSKQPVTDLLDLTVRSPQKPIVEIMRVPPILTPRLPPPSMKGCHWMKNYNTPALPLLEGRRISSNLEITLVGPNKQKYGRQHNPHLPQQTFHNTIPKQPQKRVIQDCYSPNKITRVEENGKSHQTPQHPFQPKQPHSDVGVPKPSPYVRQSSAKHDGTSKTPQAGPFLPPVSKYSTIPTAIYPNYLSHPSSPTKAMPPYMPMDAMYYQALQNLCTPNHMNPVPPMFPMPTAEQFQMYSELMSRTRMPFTYPHYYQPDNHSSIASLDNKVNKQ